MNSANYISVEEFEDYNPELDFSSYSSTTLSGMISRASAWVDNFLQYSLSIEDIVGEKAEAIVTNNGNLIVHPRKVPVQSVSAISIKLGTTNLTLNLTDGQGNARYDIPSRGKYVMYPYQEISTTGAFSIRNFYAMRERELFTVISYRAGYDTLPQDIKDAVNLIAKDVFIRQANPMDVKSLNQGAISFTFRDRDETGESDMVKDAKRILQDYVKVWE